MKKRTWSILLILVLVFSFIACGGGATPSAAPSSESPSSESPSGTPADNSTEQPAEPSGDGGDFTFTVAISLNNLDQYQTLMTEALEEELAKLGGTLIQYNADGSVEKQLADVEAMIMTRPDVIVIQAVDPDGSVTAARTAKQSEIPTVVYQLTCNVEEDDFDVRVVQLDAQIRGKVQAEWVKNWLDENPGETLYVGSLLGDPNGGNNGYKGFATIYDDTAYQGRIEEVVTMNANWLRINAVSIVEDWLVAHPQINCIQAENDEMVMGAVTTIMAAGRDIGDFITLGMNGDPDAQESIKNGELSMSAANSKRQQSAICADACYRLARGERFEGEDKFFWTDDTYRAAMDIDTIDEMLASGDFD